MANQGKVAQVIGAVVDVEFPEGKLPSIYNALTIRDESSVPPVDMVLEVQQHLGESMVRCIALSSSDGLRRGTPVGDTGAPITVPVGKETLGRVFNLLGRPIDNKGPVVSVKSAPIHRPAPALTEQATKA